MLPKIVKKAMSPKVGKRCQTLLKIVESCQLLPTGIRNGQKKPNMETSCQMMPKVSNCWQKLSKSAKT